jgi:gamma-glutamylcyclotransferase (GGCT)/AIG2-like uncharacterized protein YtfP
MGGTLKDKLFVYGTLRDGLMFQGWDIEATPYGRGVVKGLLYNMGAYPAAILSQNGKIVGDVFEIDVNDETWTKLDKYESVASGLYKRQLVHVKMTPGPVVVAYIYVWGGDKVAPERLISSGEWGHPRVQAQVVG